MFRRRVASLGIRPGWQLLLAVTLGAVLVTVVISLVVLRPGPARDVGRHRDPPAASPGPWSTADAAYMQTMLWHQEQAGELASLVQGRTTRPELRRLARGMRAAQRSGMAKMTTWLRAHRAEDALDDAGDRSTEPTRRWFAGMMAAPQLRTLAATTGQRFDFLFVDMLLEHHNGAVVMAEEVLADGRDAEVAQLASRAITDSERSIRQLTGWRRRWAEPFLRQLTPRPAQSTPASA